MLFRNWWRVKTVFGYVELELDEAGGELTDYDAIDETTMVLDWLTSGIENRDPRVSKAVVEIFAQFHPEYFTPGISRDQLETRDIDPLRETLCEFLEQNVETGHFRLYRDEIVMAPFVEDAEHTAYVPPVTKTDDEITHYIGLHLKDQDGKDVANSLVRITLPDGSPPIERKTDRYGKLRIDGIAVTGNATIELLEFNEAGKAQPIDGPLDDEFAVTVVDEAGKPVGKVPLVFRGAGTAETLKTDDTKGLATYKAKDTDTAEVTFESAKALSDLMKPLWKSRPPTKPEDYVKPSADVIIVSSRTTAIETEDGFTFTGLSMKAGTTKTISVRPSKRRAVIIEMHDTLFRTNSAVVLPEGEAPAKKVGEHESISSVGLIATILRYNEEHEGRKLFIAGHTDKAGTEDFNQPLSEERAKAVQALVEGKKADFVKLCKARNSEVDVTQLMDWTNKNPSFSFKCKPTVMNRAPSDENYYLFRKSYNEWCKGAAAANETRGTKISDTGRLQPDIWEATFDLYEYELRKELGEDAAGVAALRAKVKWVDDGKKSLGFGENHPATANAVDGKPSDADRRVEVMLFEDEDLPNLNTANGADIYDVNTYQRRRVEPMVSAKRVPYELYFAVNRVPPENPTKFSYKVSESETNWEQVKTSDEVTNASAELDSLTFRIPPAGTFSLWLLHSGASPMCLMRDMPYERLSAAGPTSAFRESSTGTDDIPDEVHVLRDDYIAIV